MYDVCPLSGISGLSFDLTFCPVALLPTLIALSVLFVFPPLARSPDIFPQKNSSIFFVKR